MKYTITIEHEPNSTWPFTACVKLGEFNWKCCAGKTSEEVEKEIIEYLKEINKKEPTITKEIEL